MNRVNREIKLGLVLIAFSAFFLKEAYDLGVGANKYPMIIIGLLGVMAIGLFLQGLYYSIRPEKYHQDTETVTWEGMKKPLECFVIIAMYVILFKLTGFYVSTDIFTPCIMWFFGEKRMSAIFLMTIGLELFVYLLFVQVLNVNFNMI